MIKKPDIQEEVDVWLIKADEAMRYREQEIKRIAETKEKLRLRTRKLGNVNASTLSIKNIPSSNVGSPSYDEESKQSESNDEMSEQDELETINKERCIANVMIDQFKVRNFA